MRAILALCILGSLLVIAPSANADVCIDGTSVRIGECYTMIRDRTSNVVYCVTNEAPELHVCVPP